MPISRRLLLAALLAGPAAAHLDEQEQRQDAFIATVVLPGLRRGLGALVDKPWQVLDGSSLLFSAEFLLGGRELRTWMYSQCISSGVGAEGSSLTMVYIGLESGEFMGYVSSSSLLLCSFRKPQDAAAAASMASTSTRTARPGAASPPTSTWAASPAWRTSTRASSPTGPRRQLSQAAIRCARASARTAHMSADSSSRAPALPLAATEACWGTARQRAATKTSARTTGRAGSSRGLRLP